MKVQPTIIPIVLAFSPSYFTPAATCILSILDHSEETDFFHIVCLVTETLPEKMRSKLEKLNLSRLRFSFVNLQGRLKDIYVDEKYTVAASYRLLLPELLPEYNKVIYVDCDMIVRNNLARLYHETDIENNYLAGVFEATLEFQLLHMRVIGCEPGEYINSGFLIMNLDLLRQDDMVPRFIEESKKEGLVFPDQDVLNRLCKGRILGLPAYYNSIRTFYLPQYKADFLKYYTEEDWDAVQSHGNIHYTGTKPWNVFTVEFASWWEYYEMLPEDIKEEGQVVRKIQSLSRINRTRLGHFIIKRVLHTYRQIKYRNL